jgi:hypothetical protein
LNEKKPHFQYRPGFFVYGGSGHEFTRR